MKRDRGGHYRRAVAEETEMEMPQFDSITVPDAVEIQPIKIESAATPAPIKIVNQVPKENHVSLKEPSTVDYLPLPLSHPLMIILMILSIVSLLQPLLDRDRVVRVLQILRVQFWYTYSGEKCRGDTEECPRGDEEGRGRERRED
eukprot:sb/3473973/